MSTLAWLGVVLFALIVGVLVGSRTTARRYQRTLARLRREARERLW